VVAILRCDAIQGGDGLLDVGHTPSFLAASIALLHQMSVWKYYARRGGLTSRTTPLTRVHPITLPSKPQVRVGAEK
jgi:hypothetical protein